MWQRPVFAGSNSSKKTALHGVGRFAIDSECPFWLGGFGLGGFGVNGGLVEGV